MPLVQTALAVSPLATTALVLAGAFGLAVALERGIVIGRSRLAGHGRPFIERLVGLVQAGEIDEALAACSATHAILPDIGLVVLRARVREERDLEAVTAAAVRSCTPRLSRRIRYIAALALAAALFGAAGTGYALGAALGSGGGAVGEALAPLTLGLGIAGALVVVHAIVANQVEALLAQVEEFARRLVNALLDRPDVRLGHR